MSHAMEEVFATAECLCPKVEVEQAIDGLADAIEKRLAGCNPLVLCVLTGGIALVGQLLPRLCFPLQLDYLHATRYNNQTHGKELAWIAHPTTPLVGRTVLVVDDILDEGLTMAAIIEYCRKAGAREVFTAVLVRKDCPRQVELCPDFVGLEIPNRYVFGYGMDYRGYWRNAPGIYAVRGL